MFHYTKKPETAEDIEDLLLEINKLLKPRECINISTVDPMTTKAVFRIWKKMGADICLNYCCYQDEDDVDSISLKSARRLLKRLAPSAKSLSIHRLYPTDPIFIKIGPFIYQVENGGSANYDEIFQLIAESSSQLTELKLIVNSYNKSIYDTSKNKETLKILFERNQINKLCTNGVPFSEYLHSSAADRIEELKLDFLLCAKPFAESFEWKFENLQKLHLTNITCTYTLKVLSKLLPHLPINLKSFFFGFDHFPDKEVDLASDLFESIFRLSQLEEFGFHFYIPNIKVTNADSFCEKLVLSCAKLRIVHLFGNRISDAVIMKLMALPQLECIYVKPTFEICPKTITTMENLYKCHFSFDRLSKTFTYVEMLRNMPKLQYVGFYRPQSVFPIVEKLVENIVCQVLQAFENRKVIITSHCNRRLSGDEKDYPTDYEEIIVERKRKKRQLVIVGACEEEKRKTLTITLINQNLHRLLIDIEEYLECNMKEHQAIMNVVKNKKRTDFSIFELTYFPQDSTK